jgi:hypothetical protein
MDSDLEGKKNRLSQFDKMYGQDLQQGVSGEDSKLRVALSKGFDREMSQAERYFAKGNYIKALEHRMTADLLYSALKNSKLG